MKKYKVSIKGTIIIEATNESWARDKAIDVFHDALIKSYKEIQWAIEEVKSE